MGLYLHVSLIFSTWRQCLVSTWLAKSLSAYRIGYHRTGRYFWTNTCYSCMLLGGDFPPGFWPIVALHTGFRGEQVFLVINPTYMAAYCPSRCDTLKTVAYLLASHDATVWRFQVVEVRVIPRTSQGEIMFSPMLKQLAPSNMTPFWAYLLVYCFEGTTTRWHHFVTNLALYFITSIGSSSFQLIGLPW